MTFENLIGLTRAELLTSPTISSFENFCFEPEKVQRGDLFIAFNKSDEAIKTAVENGAYGILCDEKLEIIDKEIAWIKVQSINMALMRLMRFESSYKKLVFISVSLLQANMLKSLVLPKNTCILSTVPLKAFNQIMKIENNSFVFCSDDLLLQKIAPIHECIFTQRNVTTQKNGSIFFSSFIYGDEYYNKIPISPIFIPAFCGVLDFLKKSQIEFSLENFKPIQNFEPIFVDASICPQSFGETRRALIVESDEELFVYEVKTLLKILPQNHLLICKHIDSKCSMEVNFLYKREEDLKQLSDYRFKYALVLGDKESISQTLLSQKTKRYPSLF